jgi:hypothetical protein
MIWTGTLVSFDLCTTSEIGDRRAAFFQFIQSPKRKKTFRLSPVFNQEAKKETPEPTLA